MGDCLLSNIDLAKLHLACVAGAKRGGGGGREKSVKEGKGKGVPAIRASVFVFHPPFSELIR